MGGWVGRWTDRRANRWKDKMIMKIFKRKHENLHEEFIFIVWETNTVDLIKIKVLL